VGIVRVARRPPGWVAPGPAPAGARGRPELEPGDDEDLCFLTGDWRLFQKRKGHRWSLDDLVTAFVATAARSAASGLRALDLGCGAGSVLLMLAWKLPGADVTGIEAQADRAAMGRRSIAYNGVEDRCRILDGDLREGAGVDGPFDLITGTPPYFPRGTGTESDLPHAAPCRFELRGGVEDYVAAAARWLAPDGRFVMCSAAGERARVESAAVAHGLAIRAHLDVIPRAGKPVLIAVDTLTTEPGARENGSLIVRDTDGQWTTDFTRVREVMGLPHNGDNRPDVGRPQRARGDG
jgi:tRNA1Val (adenine37-N6)-methyltransferase